MSHETSILEELLARVQRNAALPRTLVSAAEPVAAAPQPEYVAPAPYVAPAYVAPAYVAPEPAYVAPEPEAVYEPEPPPFQPEFESYVPPAPAAHAAPLDASVDDLLLEDPFPSAPPPPAPNYSDVLEEEPIPLVSVSSKRSHDEDISGVMVVSELNDDQPEELLEDDIVEMTPGDSEAPANNQIDDLNFDDEELDGDHASSVEEPPASSSRSKIAGTMDEALAHAAEQITLEEGREVPLKTPPPESGPQAAVALPAGIHAPLAPDIEELLEADIQPKGGVRSAVPTAEQLGQTIDLEEARGPSLELDHPHVAPLQEELPSEELEVTLPGREYAGGYTEDLMPPPEARQDLDAHRQRVGDDSVPPPPESLAQYPSQPAASASAEFAPAIVPSNVTTDSTSEGVSMVTVDAPAHAELVPELLVRPTLGPTPVAKFIRAQPPRPNTFLELLDASLSLGND
ncbi:MAG: hypothetical protein ABUL62_09980 [Myxococcales bacterium]